MSSTPTPTLLPATALLAAALLTGCPSCPYESACDDSTLQWCSIGVDQMVGDPEEGARECKAPNPVCVELDEQTAQCVTSGERTCDETVTPACEEGTVARCERGYVVAEDCAGHGNACVVVEAAPRCALEPAQQCDPADGLGEADALPAGARTAGEAA